MSDGYAFHASHGGLAGGMKVPYHNISVLRPGATRTRMARTRPAFGLPRQQDKRWQGADTR
jgi:hypothetical protein